ncbi:MAG: MFS transporter [Chloroflexi bacterium]|nr:MFS transporter [Chloroflexota bacterium]
MSVIKAIGGGYRPVILGIILLSQVGASVPTQAVPVLAPFYQVDLALNWTQVGLVVSAISLGQLVTALLGGVATDYVGVRRMFLAGQVVVGSFIVVLSTTPSFSLALPLGFVTGMGVSMASPGASKVVLSWFSQGSRATVMGIKQTAVPICGGIAASVLPPLALLSGWRWAMVATGLAVVAIGLVVYLAYREPDSAERMAPNGSHARPTLQSGPSRDFGWVGVKEVVLNRDLCLTGILGLGLVGAQFSVATYLIFYFRDVFVVPVVVAGAYLALAQLSGVIGRVGLGLVSDLFLGGRRKLVLATCSFLGTAILAALSLAGPHLPQLAVIALLAALGLCVLGFHGVWVTLLCELGGADRAATAAGLGSTFSMTGGTFAPTIFGMIMDATQSYQIAWGAMSALVAVTSVTFLFTREERRSG